MSKSVVAQTTNLPDTIEDLSKFVLIGREKLTAVRAEIRAIDKLKLAEDVYSQKLEEAAMLAEAVLDAEVRLGELFQAIPKKPGKRTDLQPPRTDAEKLKSKAEVVEDLGFSQDQAQRFEVMADYKDVVELVKAEARENADIPTRKRVLEVVSQKKKGGDGADDFDSYFNFHVKTCEELDKIVDSIDKFEVTESRIDALLENFDGAARVGDTIKHIENAREKLATIVAELQKAARRAKKAE